MRYYVLRSVSFAVEVAIRRRRSRRTGRYLIFMFEIQ